MKWLRIQEYIFPIDKILHVHTGDIIGNDSYLIFIKLTTDDSHHFIYPSQQERDEAFETICKQLQW